MKYKIGDTVWHATLEHGIEHVTCPDCCGRRTLVVTLGDDSTVSIECSTCARGYEPPRGFIERDTHTIAPTTLLITKVETKIVNAEEVTLYSGPGRYRANESDLCPTIEEASVKAAALLVERDKEAAERMKRKEKDGRTWSWHVTYHRRCIKQAEKDLAYHRAKLAVSLPHVKEEKSLKVQDFGDISLTSGHQSALRTEITLDSPPPFK